MIDTDNNVCPLCGASIVGGSATPATPQVQQPAPSPAAVQQPSKPVSEQPQMQAPRPTDRQPQAPVQPVQQSAPGIQPIETAPAPADPVPAKGGRKPLSVVLMILIGIVLFVAGYLLGYLDLLGLGNYLPF